MFLKNFSKKLLQVIVQLDGDVEYASCNPAAEG